MLDIPGLDDETMNGDFPAKYVGDFLTKDEADALHEKFIDWLYCHRQIQKSGQIQKRMGVAFAGDPGHSQCRGTYDEMFTVVDQDHCDGPTLPSNDAPEVILSLQKKLTAYLRTMPGYEHRTVNYLSVMYYADHEVGIDWHKHAEDDGIDTPVLIVSTGEPRPFHLGLQNRTPRGKKPKPIARWSRIAEHGSLIVMPASFNDTHWHAILHEDYPCGVRISVNTKCLTEPRVFSIKRKHPRFATYVGCKSGKYQGTIYGNGVNPLQGHYPMVAKTETAFRLYAEKKMLDPAFREQAIKDLRGKHLLCWCIQDGPERDSFCHARVWLEIVNRA